MFPYQKVSSSLQARKSWKLERSSFLSWGIVWCSCVFPCLYFGFSLMFPFGFLEFSCNLSLYPCKKSKVSISFNGRESWKPECKAFPIKGNHMNLSSFPAEKMSNHVRNLGFPIGFHVFPNQENRLFHPVFVIRLFPFNNQTIIIYCNIYLITER